MGLGRIERQGNKESTVPIFPFGKRTTRDSSLTWKHTTGSNSIKMFNFDYGFVATHLNTFLRDLELQIVKSYSLLSMGPVSSHHTTEVCLKLSQLRLKS